MQDEVSKHTRKIYQEIKHQGHGFWEKFREVAIEICIIVFAVTLSIWLHNWSDHRQEQRETDEFLRGLQVDLGKDIELMEENRQAYLEVDSDFSFIERLNQTGAIDTTDGHVITHHLNFQLVTTHSNVARYEGFKSSGKIGTIESDSLKQAILTYYQQTIPGIIDGEDLVNGFQTRVMEAEINRDEKVPASARVLAKTLKMRALLEFSTKNLEPAIQRYRDAEGDAKRMIGMIDRYLEGRE